VINDGEENGLRSRALLFAIVKVTMRRISGGSVVRGLGKMVGVTLVYLVQHGDKEHSPGDPGLTGRGREQADRTGRWLASQDVAAVWASPLRRAQQTAECIAAVTGLTVRRDARLAERLNWDGTIPFDAFLALWAHTSRDRDLVPAGGQSSRQAGARLAAFLASMQHRPGPVAAVTHGGVTTDLVRNLLGDDGLPPELLAAGIPPCAITAIDGLDIVLLASDGHLR
jgi:broad specificity phosphatase PhoE